MRKTQFAFSGFEDEDEVGSEPKKHRQPLKAGKSKETFSLESPEGMQLCLHLDFSPVRHILDFWLPKL